MPFAIAALLVVIFINAASAQPVLDDMGRVYPCLRVEPGCALPAVSTHLQAWPSDLLRVRKHIPPPPFLGARPSVPYVPPLSVERSPNQ